ncbi:uncharacterized protein BHQ10_006814 [Talaromyces amestolkiae]|uniref:Uncharacterized protein n=1 Tax=Talaromyces amestolkiae TaxID=1196081 RepID=A0A364L4T3_TALAM|nr:uncharacterized protein BHQ10_006814 [Talaromyces amestolkiae]RAO70802.1 hypothetical protein BHQ10_006814 [Talaromyces amestolkiae]
MYSCSNYPRGCRGRCNIQGGKCSDCTSLNLRRPRTMASPFAQNQGEFRRLAQMTSCAQPEAPDKSNQV